MGMKRVVRQGLSDTRQVDWREVPISMPLLEDVKRRSLVGCACYPWSDCPGGGYGLQWYGDLGRVGESDTFASKVRRSLARGILRVRGETLNGQLLPTMESLRTRRCVRGCTEQYSCQVVYGASAQAV